MRKFDKLKSLHLQETNGKVQPVQLTFRNPSENYFFMSWNWPLLRKVSMAMFLSGLVALVALVIAMISVLPRKCNPVTQWYQGGVIYEIFPASYLDTNEDSYGDFNGIALTIDYLSALGVKAVRLNSIFASHDYPEDYKNFTSLKNIAPQLGTEYEFRKMCEKLHAKNISVILDLSLKPVLSHLSVNNYNTQHVTEDTHQDIVAEAFEHWLQIGVDGFYVKDLEYFISDPRFPNCIRRWKAILGADRPLIVSQKVINMVPNEFRNILLNHVDLVDIVLNVEAGATSLSQQIESVLNGSLFLKPGMPWVHWTLGNENTVRLSNRLQMGNATLGATLLQMMLPGTPSIFYGDEIELTQISDPNGDRKDLQHLHQFAPMAWPGRKRKMMHMWMHDEDTKQNFDQSQIIAKMIALRSESPAIYINSVHKDRETKASAEVKYSQQNFLVIQRWYPRRRSYVVVSNLGSVPTSSDLSTLLYTGQIVVGPRLDSVSASISFNDVSLWPGESVIVALD